jgi:pyruvate dehydrogenase E2 component (dihydrolipoamide acetyltransferase)
MPNQIKLPNLGENIESGDVLSILVSEGDTVAKDQDLLELETDKATMPVPSPSAGKITKIMVSEGDTIKVGAAFMEIESAAAAPAPAGKAPAAAPAKPSSPPAASTSAASAAKQAKPAPAEPPATVKMTPKPQPAAPQRAAATATQKPPAASKQVAKANEEDTAPNATGDGHAASAAGPAVRRLARQLGVDLRLVRPTGDGGRITTEDVQAFVRETNEQVAATTSRGVTPPGTPDSDDYGGIRVEKMSRMRQTIARNMVASYTTIPQLTNFDDVDITELEDMRSESKGDYEARGIKLTTMSFLIKAAASALKRHPIVNSSVDMDEQQIIYKEYVNIGVAVDTERGLVVPVLRNVDRKSISQIAADLDHLAALARSGELSLEDMRGGTFTISNLGAVGGTYSTPIINPPEVAILLAGRSRILPQFVGGAHSIESKVEPRLMLPLSISYDHRAVDGAAAARFLNDVKGYLSAPGRLLLAP